MKLSIAQIALLVGGLLAAAPTVASDMKAGAPVWRYNGPAPELPFVRSGRAQSVWAAGACWSECGSYCAWGFSGCLKQDAQGHCIKLTDACDRRCQRECRLQGGPLVPDIFDF
jgi:hypothetical protein